MVPSVAPDGVVALPPVAAHALPHVAASLYAARSGYHLHHNHIHSPGNYSRLQTSLSPTQQSNKASVALTSSPCQ